MVLLVPFLAGAAGDPWRALLTSHLGLPLSLGAFLAGLVMSESEYAHHALEGVLPFKDVFTSLFFVSMGMLLDTGYLTAHLPLVLGVAEAVLLVKLGAAAGATLCVGYSLRTALMAGLALCQVGEFSFILAREGVEHGLLGNEGYQLFLAASVLTMALTPFLIRLAPVVVREGSAMDGVALADGELRRAGAMLTAVLRGDEVMVPPSADLRLAPGDTAYRFGRRDDVSRAAGLFRSDQG